MDCVCRFTGRGDDPELIGDFRREVARVLDVLFLDELGVVAAQL